MTGIPDAAFGHALNLLTPANPVLLQRLLIQYQNFRVAYFTVAGRTKKGLDVPKELAELDKQKIKLLSCQDKKYPACLRDLPDSPALLYYRGAMSATDELCLAVVGTRRASEYGRQITPHLVQPVSESGITIVSGLAYGIDSFAHSSALECGGRTIAALPGGLDDASIYPPNHLGLARKILTGGGALVSEYAPGVLARKHHFLARNRIIAGLAAGTLIVECDIKSGALITARHALDYNRSVYAAPGSIISTQSRGTNALIKQGAQLVVSADDILDDLRVPMARRAGNRLAAGASAAGTSLSPAENKILAELKNAPRQRDEIIKNTGLAADEVMASLTFLEIKGIIRQLGTGRYTLIKHE